MPTCVLPIWMPIVLVHADPLMLICRLHMPMLPMPMFICRCVFAWLYMPMCICRSCRFHPCRRMYCRFECISCLYMPIRCCVYADYMCLCYQCRCVFADHADVMLMAIYILPIWMPIVLVHADHLMHICRLHVPMLPMPMCICRSCRFHPCRLRYCRFECRSVDAYLPITCADVVHADLYLPMCICRCVYADVYLAIMPI